jgi:hypothetical protein
MGKTNTDTETEYEKYFSFDMIDYANYGINIEPPIPPALPDNNFAQQEIVNSDSISEQIVEVDDDMNYNFDIVNYTLDPSPQASTETPDIDFVWEEEDDIGPNGKIEKEEPEEEEKNPFENIPMEVRRSDAN